MMSNKEQDLKKVKKSYRPELFPPVFLTIICIAPYLWLFIDIADRKYDRLNMLAILSGLCICIITLTWTHVFIGIRKYKKEVKDYLRDPNKYEW